MGKRCETINGGKPCPCLATDGSCLIKPPERRDMCPARETVENEYKDEWMLKRHFVEKPEKNVKWNLNDE
jgi:hypothetical protein